MAHDEKPITLPVSIVSPTDIARLTREIEQIEGFFQDQQIRQAGEPSTIPRLSKLMDQLAADNQLNLLNKTDRGHIFQLLESLHESAPVMHISFSVDPPGAYVQKIVTWLRQNIHRHVLVTVGLQPNIGAGCIVRTTNRLFDFSLREFFAQKREFFIKRLHAAITEPGVEAPTSQQPDTEKAPSETPAATPITANETTEGESHQEQASRPTQQKPEMISEVVPIPAPVEQEAVLDNTPKVVPIVVQEPPKPLTEESP